MGGNPRFLGSDFAESEHSPTTTSGGGSFGLRNEVDFGNRSCGKARSKAEPTLPFLKSNAFVVLNKRKLRGGELGFSATWGTTLARQTRRAPVVL